MYKRYCTKKETITGALYQKQCQYPHSFIQITYTMPCRLKLTKPSTPSKNMLSENICIKMYKMSIMQCVVCIKINILQARRIHHYGTLIWFNSLNPSMI